MNDPTNTDQAFAENTGDGVKVKRASTQSSSSRATTTNATRSRSENAVNATTRRMAEDVIFHTAICSTEKDYAGVLVHHVRRLVYLASALLAVAVVSAAYVLGSSSYDPSNEISTGSVREGSPAEGENSQTSEASADNHPRGGEGADDRLIGKLTVTEGSVEATGERDFQTATNVHLIIARLHRLDDEFSRLKAEVVDFQKAEEQQAKDATRNAALAKGISSGRLFLKASRLNSKARIPLVYVPAGLFVMGQTDAERSRSARASSSAHFDFSYPAHPVRIETGYFIGVYEITVGQLAEFASEQAGNASAHADFDGVDRKIPASKVDWGTAMKFCDWLSQLNPGVQVRLPTEIEWEYAARGNRYVQRFEGLREPEVVMGGPWPVDSDALDRSWCGCVGLNSNVQEWTIEKWNDRAYQRRVEELNASGTNAGFIYNGFVREETLAADSPRTVRGSSFRDVAANRQLALRRFKPMSAKEDTLGFRVVVPLPIAAGEGDQYE